MRRSLLYPGGLTQRLVNILDGFAARLGPIPEQAPHLLLGAKGEEIAGMVAYLASPEAAFVTGGIVSGPIARVAVPEALSPLGSVTV